MSSRSRPILTRDLKTEEGNQADDRCHRVVASEGLLRHAAGDSCSRNEGEIVVDTANGLQYTLRFGEIASGGAADAPDGADTEAPDAPADGAEPAAGDAAEAADAAGERRYLFITVAHSADRARQYAEGVNPAGAGEDTPSVGETLATELRERFADWYYVITGADFNTLRPRRRDPDRRLTRVAAGWRAAQHGAHRPAGGLTPAPRASAS